jgi:hypothetical protein
MTRAVHFALVLLLVGISLVSVTASVAAQQELPAAFFGQWAGSTDEVPSNADVPVTVDLTGGSLGAVVGTMALPNHACGGDVTLQRVAADGRQIELAVSITYGAACINGGLVTLTLQSDRSVFYDWRHPSSAVTATGTLTRTGGASAPSTDQPPQADWCAQVTATYGPTPTLSGPWDGGLEQRQGSSSRANAAVSVANFVATAMLYNPTTSTTVPWDFGFAFRETADERAVQQIFIDSRGNWYHASFPQGVLASGVASSYNFSPGAGNALDLVVEGETASFCLNGQFVSTVQLPPAVASDVLLVTGLLEGDQSIVTGRVINYENFSVWALPSTTAQTVPPSTCQWTGTWDTEFGSLRLTQRGDTVSGDYDVDQGQISGRVIGDTLSGTWNEAPSRQAPTDAGEIVFKMAADCQSFDGKWRYAFGDTWYFDWAAERVSN